MNCSSSFAQGVRIGTTAALVLFIVWAAICVGAWLVEGGAL